MAEPDSENLAETTVDRVKQRIRDEIQSGRMLPGVRMKLADIAERFHVSQMPVREALGHLSAEGLIVMLPNKGASVRPVDRQFVDDMYDCRGALEGLVARRCAERATATEIKQLRALAAAYAKQARLGNLSEMVHTNREFHRQLTTISRNVLAMRLLDQGWELIFGFRVRNGPSKVRVRQIIHEHRELVDAIEARDAESAEAIARLHSVHAREDVLRLIAK